jgi:hypothetical protein
MKITSIQLKPSSESFYKIVFEKLKKLDAIVLCEGRSDVEVIKKILSKFTTEEGGRVHIGFTDCEGRENIPYITTIISTLSKIYRKLRYVVIIIDADEFSVEDRVESIVNSLKSRNIQVREPQQDITSKQVYITEVISNGRTLKLLITVNGDFSPPTRRHVLKDHCVKLMGIRIQGDIDSTKQLIKDIKECLRHIDESTNDVVCEVFNHICRLLQILSSI